MSVKHLVSADFSNLIKGGKTIIPRISPEMLAKFQARAKLQKDPGAKPYLIEPIDIPSTELELFFDIETDPMRDICYLHGFVERRGKDPSTEKYVYFFAEGATEEDEKSVFADALEYIQASQPCAIYYYSSYEKAQWRKLQKKYPKIVAEGEIEEIFSRDTAVDLYHNIVKSKTEWPTRDYSIKTLAKYLGFKWRDTDPSGAASIEWFSRWVDTGDESIRTRILEYNEDDCLAMRVLLDSTGKLKIQKDD
jgi:predicted RecB family nuclease